MLLSTQTTLPFNNAKTLRNTKSSKTFIIHEESTKELRTVSSGRDKSRLLVYLTGTPMVVAASALTFKELSLKIGILKSFKDFFKEFRFLRIFLRNFRNILSWTKNVGRRITTPRK